MNAHLPDAFAALEPFATDWAIPGSIARAARRGAADPAARAAFFAAASPRLDEALAYLDERPLATLNARDQRLMNMMLALAHVSLTEELLGDQEPSHRRQRQHMRITRSPAGA